MSIDIPANEALLPAASTLPVDFFAFLEEALSAAPAVGVMDDPETLIGIIQAATAANAGVAADVVGADGVETKGREQADVVGQVTAQLKSQQLGLAPALRVRLLFWQTLFSQLQEIGSLDPQLKIEFERLRPSFLICGLRDETLATSTTHPLRQLLDKMLQESVFWYPDTSKESQQFFAALTAALAVLAQPNLSLDEQLADPALAALMNLMSRQRRRAEMMEQRFSESELGLAKIQRVQAQVNLLLSSLVGSLLPEAVATFLRTTLRTELQYLLINEGDSSPVWKSWGEVIRRLPQIYSQPATVADDSAEPDTLSRQLLFTQVQVLLEWLNKTEAVSVPNQQAYAEGVEQLREHLFSRLRDEQHPLLPFAPLMEPDELRALGTTVSPAHVKKVAHLREGDWFLFSADDDRWLRCKLLLRPPQIEQLLFVNRHGQRVLQKSPHEFSACLATHIARPLQVVDIFSAALTATEKKLRVWQQQTLVRTRRETRADAAPSAPAGGQASSPVADQPSSVSVAVQNSDEEQPKETVPPPAIDRQAAAAKALQEAQALERLAIERERPPATQPAVTEQDARGSAAALLATANIGAWFDLVISGQRDFQRCKLVAIIRSTDRYIFTDRAGAKVAEYAQAELLELLVTDAARLISNGDDFEGQLTKVVKTLRRDS